MSDDAPERLRELGKQLPFDKPDAERREAVRSGLLVAATQDHPSTARKRWFLIGGGFAAGALAAAAIAIVVVAPRDAAAPIALQQPREAHARIEAPTTAKLEHTVTASSTGTDEVVRVRAGVVRVAVPVVKAGDRVRMQTADAEVEGTGAYEVAVVDDRLERVTVTEGRAQVTVRVSGKQQQVVLAAGQTWRPTIVTADLELPAQPALPAASTDATTTQPTTTTPTAATAPATNATNATAATETKTAPATGTPATKTTAATGTSPATEPPSVTAMNATGAPPTATKTAASGTATTTTGTPPATGKSATDAAKQTSGADAARDSRVAATPEPPAPSMPAVTSLEIKTGKQPSVTEHHFKTGWALLRAGKAREAAVELGIAADAGADDPLAADARYFQAVALVRAGEPATAERVLVAFLDRAPTSLRRGRAAVLLGKLLRDRGDIKSARAWFESAVGDADPAVATAARAHLESVR